MGIIYKITSPTGRIYVGQTNCFKRRQYDYKCNRNRLSNSTILKSVRKYGWDAHKMEIIEEVVDALMDEREIFWIQKLRSFYYENKRGMNLTKGGNVNRQPWKHDKRRVAKARLRCGEKSANFGKKWPEEMKLRIANGVSKYNIENGKKPLELCRLKSVEMLSVPIVVYNVDGDFVGEYSSVKLAALTLGVDRKTLNDALNGKQFHGGGYIPKRKTDKYPLKIEVDKSKILIRRRPILCFFDGEPIAEFNTIKEVANGLNLKIGTVGDAFYDGRITRDGYFFIYTDLYAEIEKLTA